jgi:hypothetical protein
MNLFTPGVKETIRAKLKQERTAREATMKSSKESVARSEALYAEVREKLPGVMLRNRSVTTSSIYLKTPDGFSLRIGDHRGKEKYSYKWNLNPDQPRPGWRKEFNQFDKTSHWRYYTASVDDLVAKVLANVRDGVMPRDIS